MLVLAAGYTPMKQASLIIRGKPTTRSHEHAILGPQGHQVKMSEHSGASSVLCGQRWLCPASLCYNPAKGERKENLKGLASIASKLREERTNLVNELRHVDAALSVLGKLNGGRFYTKP